MVARIRGELRQERRLERLRRVVTAVKLAGLLAVACTVTALSLTAPGTLVIVGH